MDKIRSYPKVYNLGHHVITDLFKNPVIVEEKIDGSQFSFGISDGTIFCRSKGKQIDLDAPDKMFQPAIETVHKIINELTEGYIYRCEFLSKPKHNTLVYDRIPKDCLILFDIDRAIESYMAYEEKKKEAEKIGLECVPILHEGVIENFDDFKKLLEKKSCLGDVPIEGIVIKNYHRFAEDGKALMGKFVSEVFKETHEKDWKVRHQTGKDIIQQIGESLTTEARWEKSIQHLKEKGGLTNTPKDIGLLLKEICNDVQTECEGYIKDKLFEWAWKNLSRAVVRGFPQWYKEKLAKGQFNNE